MIVPNAERAMPGGLIQVLEDGLGRRVDGRPMTRMEKLAVASFVGFALQHSCIGARTVARKGFFMTVLRSLDTVEDAVAMLMDLESYYQMSDGGDEILKTLVVVYVGHPLATQDDFELAYWPGMQLAHDVDAHAYDPTVGSDPAEMDFELSLAGRAVFTTTLNPGSPRYSRRWIYPTLVMNQLNQFNKLREQGMMPRWQTSIRKADIDLQGSANPILLDHGMGSAALQLAGSSHFPCPFTPRTTHEARVEALQAAIRRAQSEEASEAVISELRSRLAKLMAGDHIGRAGPQTPGG